MVGLLTVAVTDPLVPIRFVAMQWYRTPDWGSPDTFVTKTWPYSFGIGISSLNHDTVGAGCPETLHVRIKLAGMPRKVSNADIFIATFCDINRN